MGTISICKCAVAIFLLACRRCGWFFRAGGNGRQAGRSRKVQALIAHSSEPLLTMPWASSGGISLEMPVCMHTREGGAYPPSLAPLSPRKDGHWCTCLARPSTSSSVQCWAVHPIFMSPPPASRKRGRLWSHLFNRNIVVFLKGHALWWLIQFCSDLLTVGAVVLLPSHFAQSFPCPRRPCTPEPYKYIYINTLIYIYISRECVFVTLALQMLYISVNIFPR